MADFPRIKWLNVDGQQVPFTEPQHFTGNGDETVRTGHDNPLPVANYTQNESGLWLPTSKENPMPTQVTGSIAELFKIENYRLNSGQSKWFDNFELTKPYYRFYVYFIHDDGNEIMEEIKLLEQRLILGIDTFFVTEGAKDLDVFNKTHISSSKRTLISSNKYTTESSYSRIYINNTSDYDVDFSVQVVVFEA